VKSLIVAVALVAASAAACQRGPDVKDMADGALKSVALNDKVDADYDRSAKVLRLSGTVDTDSERSRAETAVKNAIGQYAQVADEIVVKGLDAKTADDLDGGIEKRFKTLVDSTPDLKDRDVNVRVENGVVTLSGSTRTAAERASAESLARSVPGVTEVVNAITVQAN
jgi:osmotically-inducible protein OsmY